MMRILLALLLLTTVCCLRAQSIVKAIVGDTVLIDHINVRQNGFGCGTEYQWYIQPSLYDNFSIKYFDTNAHVGADAYFAPKSEGIYQQHYYGFFDYTHTDPRSSGCGPFHYDYDFTCIAYPKNSSMFMPDYYTAELVADFTIKRYIGNFTIYYRNDTNVHVTIGKIALLDTPDSRITLKYASGAPATAGFTIYPKTIQRGIELSLQSKEGPYDDNPPNRNIRLVIEKMILTDTTLDTIVVGVNFRPIVVSEYAPVVTPSEVVLEAEVGKHRDTTIEINYTKVKISKIHFDTLSAPLELLEVESKVNRKRVFIRYEPRVAEEFTSQEIFFPFEIVSFDTNIVRGSSELLITYRSTMPQEKVSHNEASGVSIYPNPAKGVVTITVGTDHSGEVPITISNSLGNVVHTKNIYCVSGKLVLQLDRDILPGVYDLSLIISDKKYIEKLIVIQ